MTDPNQDLDTLLGQETIIQAEYKQVIVDAANMRFGDNPVYEVADFVAFYPQFGSVDGSTGAFTGVLPEVVLQAYINLASASLSQLRWQDSWPIGMALFVAHFATLWCRSSSTAVGSAKTVAAAGIAKGIQVSKSVGDASTSYQTIASDLEGWGSFALTDFGQQFITMARIIGMGGMYLW